MMGIVFNLLEQVVQDQFGELAWDKLVEAAGVPGSYTSLGSYPDADALKLVAAASSAWNQSPDAVLRWFGQRALPLLAKKYPLLFQKHLSTRSFLLTLNDIIHPEVRKLYPGADVPEFEFDVASPEALGMAYVSKRRLCAFAEGLVLGSAAHFGEEAFIEQAMCMNRGDAKCLFRLSFRRAGAPIQ